MDKIIEIKNQKENETLFAYTETYAKIKKLKMQLDELSIKVMEIMQKKENKDCTFIIGNLATLSLKDAYTQTRIDNEKLKTKFNEVYLKCLKDIKISASIKVTPIIK